ncbi:MAG: hypothetical protein DCC52_12420, partial [Chloroflexi bacterium]
RKYENRLAYWVSEQDAGQADAINKGWRRATGEIIAYLNSDDTYEPGAVRAAVEFLAQHPETAMVYGHCYQINPQGERVGMLRAIPVNIHTLLLHNAIMQPTAFIRRRVLDHTGMLDVELGHAMDYDLWLRIALHQRIDALPVSLANFRAHEESKSVAKPFVFVQDRKRILKRFFANPQLPPSLRALEHQALVNSFLTTILGCFALDQLDAGKELWNQMTVEYPDYMTQSESIIEFAANIAVHNVGAPWLNRAAQDPIQWLKTFMSALPPNAYAMRKLEPRIIARIHTIRAFEAYWAKNCTIARIEILRAWRRDPQLLKNRGLVSIWIETLVGADVMQLLRRRPLAAQPPTQ